MAIPQLLLARQAVSLLAVAKQVHTQLDGLPPEQREAMAADLKRVGQLTASFSARGLTRFRGDKLTAWSASDAGRRGVAEHEVEELKQLLARLSAVGAQQVEAAARTKSGKGMKGRATTLGMQVAAGQAHKWLRTVGAAAPPPVIAPEDPGVTVEAEAVERARAGGGGPVSLSGWLMGRTQAVHPEATSDDELYRLASAQAFLLLRHALLPHARFGGAQVVADEVERDLSTSTALTTLDGAYAALSESLSVAASKRTGQPLDACRLEAQSTLQVVVGDWAERHGELLRAAAEDASEGAPNVQRVREQVELLLSYERDLDVEPNGDVSFRHGSACMFIGVDDWEGHAVIRLTMPLLIGAEPTAELWRRVAEEGTYRFGHLVALPSVDDVDVHFVHAILGDYLNAPELQLVVDQMAALGDELDDELALRFGTKRFRRESEMPSLIHE